MTVQLKPTIVRKAINEIVNTGIDRGDAELIAPILLSTRGMDINLDDGTVTLKFKPNKAAVTSPSTKPAKVKSKAKGKKAPVVSDAPTFERGEKSSLKREFKSNIADYKEKGVVLKQFGQAIEIKDKPFLIVGFEDGKFLCRNEKGRDVKKPLKTVLNIIGGDVAPKAKPAKAKPSKTKSKKFSIKAVEMKKGPKEAKLSSKEKRELSRKFSLAATKLSKDGVESDWFYKVVTVGKRRLRLLKLSASKKQFGAVNVDTGKRTKISIADLLPL